MPGPLKQRTPGLAGDPGLEKNLMQKNGESHPTHFHQNPQCQACAFFQIIHLQGNQTRHLCHLLGAKRPMAGMAGCTFIAGQWDAQRLDYNLTDDNEQGKLGFPNLARRGNGLVSIPNADEQIADNNITAIHSPAGRISGKVVNHISRVMTSGFPRGASSFARARERHDPAFLF